MMKLSKRGLDFIKRWEGFVPFIYDDLVKVNGRYVEWKGGKIIGTLTIGYGHTSAAAGKYPMVVGTRITEERATQLLDDDLDPVEHYVNRVVKVPLTQGQFDALVSITFNFGQGNLQKSVLLARLNAGDYQGARAAFDLYVYSKGRRLRGLVERRKAEKVLWDTPDPVALPKEKRVPVVPTDYSSRDVVPATPKEIDQPAQPRASTTVEGGGGIATSTLGGGGMIEQGTEALNKASDYADKVGNVANAAEQLGVQPLSLANIIGTKAAAFFGFLFASPTFWACFVIFLVGIAIYVARRYRARQETVPGAYELAGTPLPKLLEDDDFADVDVSDDPDTSFYQIDPNIESRVDAVDAPVNVEEPSGKKAARRSRAKRKTKE